MNLEILDAVKEYENLKLNFESQSKDINSTSHFEIKDEVGYFYRASFLGSTIKRNDYKCSMPIFYLRNEIFPMSYGIQIRKLSDWKKLFKNIKFVKEIRVGSYKNIQIRYYIESYKNGITSITIDKKGKITYVK